MFLFVTSESWIGWLVVFVSVTDKNNSGCSVFYTECFKNLLSAWLCSCVGGCRWDGHENGVGGGGGCIYI